MKPLPPNLTPPNLTPPNPDAVILGWGGMFKVPEYGFKGWIYAGPKRLWIECTHSDGTGNTIYAADRQSEVARLNIPLQCKCGHRCGFSESSEFGGGKAFCPRCAESGYIIPMKEVGDEKPEPESDTPTERWARRFNLGDHKEMILSEEESDTPRCDAEEDIYTLSISSELGRRLERENRGLREALMPFAVACNAIEDSGVFIGSLDDYRKALEAITKTTPQ